MQELGRDSTDLFDQKHSQHKSGSFLLLILNSPISNIIIKHHRIHFFHSNNKNTH